MSNQVSQVPINNTYQVYVPPGDQTGLYYILLANLPWQTSWQQLKDHVRTVCSVERVEIFNESTSGWVMVRGRENFNRAYKLLSGGLFNGRPIFADDRNATEPTAIKILAGSALPEAASRTPRALAYAAASPPPSLVSCTTASSSLPAQTMADYGQMWTAAPPYSAITSPTVSCYAANAVPAAMEYDYGENRHWYADPGLPAPGAPAGAYLEGGGYPYPQAYATAAGGGGCDGVTAARGGGGGFVETEKRKIIIKGLPDWTQYQHVHELVRAAAGPDPDASHISLPASRHGGGGASRGYAIVTFRHPDAAEAAIRHLHNYDFEGRRLTAKHTKEGVSESEDSRGGRSGGGGATQHHHHHHHHHHHPKKGHHAGGSGHASSGGGGGSGGGKHRREDREKRDGHAKGTQDRKDRKDKAPPPPPPPPPSTSSSSLLSSSKRGVVIADGSTKRTSEGGSGGDRRKPG